MSRDRLGLPKIPIRPDRQVGLECVVQGEMRKTWTCQEWGSIAFTGTALLGLAATSESWGQSPTLKVWIFCPRPR